ncbi:MAG TPA: methyl-accepting chemotaxis protein [Methylomusa anaerophila]|uniref:Methyl-accepting chemotaxis protein McpA n=1 Tax=Methylomusa anaerophila TaxID=1930071 RepID=A0A348AI53_9FIRM|nr:methyl-accepting chemotaxis protein [Methylomusa anaerophila]BBB90751.1 methyl-accepting chemotaxis protein McpA [Methylomusa anaerophila]HML88645.1 methyl-accepting chemotaxis protein [Methylomusa anaerophila]
MKITSMKTRLLIILLPFFILSFGALVGISYYLSLQALSQSVDETAAAMGSDYASRISGQVYSAKVQLESFAGIKRIYNPSDRQALKEALSECVSRLDILENITYIAPDGIALRPDGSTVNLGDREYFKQVITTKKPAVSDALMNRTTGKAGINVAVPVLYEGKLTGVLTGSISIEKMHNLVKEAKFKETGYALVLDSNGVVIVHPRFPEMQGKLNFSQKEINPELKLQRSELDDRLVKLVQEAASGKTVRGKYQFVDGIDRIGTIVSINLLGGQRWFMMVTAPEAEAIHELSALKQSLLGGAFVCILLAGVFIFIISKRIATPITLIRNECMQLAQGDLRERPLNISSYDEIGQLTRDFKEMRNNLYTLVSKVLSQSEQLAASSEELTASAHQSADASSQIASSVAEIASGSEQQVAATGQVVKVAQELSARTGQISLAAQEVSSIALSTVQSAEQGRQAVDRTEEQMNGIGKESIALESAIVDLSKGSREISEIVTLISTISNQTNLLALNAAIEAARAGEAGRGFAVVAEEVRKLAEESNQATQKIGTLIQQNQINMDRAVAASQTGAAGIKSGILMVHSTGETFKNIVEAILKLSGEIKDIAAAINQMAEGNQSLFTAIREIETVGKTSAAQSQTISGATEEQTAAMQEIATSSQSLAQMATELTQAVSKFKI